MLVRQNQSFNISEFSGTGSARLDRRAAANMLVSAYEGVLKEPLPDRIEKLVRELAGRDERSQANQS